MVRSQSRGWVVSASVEMMISPAGAVNPALPGRANPLLRLAHYLHAVPGSDSRRLVAAVVVDNDDLVFAVVILVQQRVQCAAEVGRFVVRRDDD